MKSQLPAKQSAGQLETLATEIQEHFELGERAYGTALEHARAIGERLVAAKDVAGHGNWKPWVEAKCRFSMDTAERFMKIHREWNLLKSATVRILGVRDAVAYISAEKKKAKQDTLTGGKDDAVGATAGKRAADHGHDAADVAQQDDDTASACTAQPACRNCGCTEFDEDDDCVQCHEPRVWPRLKAKPERNAKAKVKPDTTDEVVIEADVIVEDHAEPHSIRDCYVHPVEADFSCPEEPLDDDAVDRLEVLLEMMERPLSLMLEHDAVAALSDHDPLKVGLIRLERVIEQVSADLTGKRPISLKVVQVA